MTIGDVKKFITALYCLGERQFKNEIRAREMILSYINDFSIPYAIEEFTVSIPRVLEAELLVDGFKVPCAATAMTSGSINESNHLISSLTSSQSFLFVENINFNPLCPEISRSNHYFAPALAVSKKMVPLILRSQKITGKVRIKKQSHRSANILIGNIVNPRYLIFSHYDSLYGGAVDNASGTALSLFLCLKNPILRKKSLFIFSGNEELSFDKPIYWGKGYRIFEKKHKSLLQKAKRILVLDSIGFGKTFFIGDEKVARLGFPIRCLPEIISKVRLVCGDLQKMMTFYHSKLDKPALIKESELDRAAREVNRLLI